MLITCYTNKKPAFDGALISHIERRIDVLDVQGSARDTILETFQVRFAELLARVSFLEASLGSQPVMTMNGGTQWIYRNN